MKPNFLYCGLTKSRKFLMSSTFIAIAASVTAVAILVVVGVKLAKRCRGSRQATTAYFHPPTATASQFYSPYFNPYMNPYPSPQLQNFHKSAGRCMHCGSCPRGVSNEYFTPPETPRKRNSGTLQLNEISNF